MLRVPGFQSELVAQLPCLGHGAPALVEPECLRHDVETFRVSTPRNEQVRPAFLRNGGMMRILLGERITSCLIV